jgi:hypothetical protein
MIIIINLLVIGRRQLFLSVEMLLMWLYYGSFQVKHVRNIESHFLSAEECIMAGYFQNKQPNPCRFSPVGFFGSKFVTVCVTGMYVTYLMTSHI